jgi:quercetin dioxygenase-like cupin family protein
MERLNEENAGAPPPRKASVAPRLCKTEAARMNKTFFKSLCLVATALAVLAAASYSQEKRESDSAHKIVRFGDLKWTPIIKGCDLAQVSGDPSAEGAPFVLRIRCADGTRVPPHWHPTDENVTVLKGTFLLGLGETFDETKLQTMNVGNYVLMSKEMRHFALCKGDMIVQIHGTGPFKNNWVNPSEVQPPDAPAAAAKP